jgi:hypothetical protein
MRASQSVSVWRARLKLSFVVDDGLTPRLTHSLTHSARSSRGPLLAHLRARIELWALGRRVDWIGT